MYPPKTASAALSIGFGIAALGRTLKRGNISMSIRNLSLCLTFCALGFLGYASAGHATLIDPATLQIGGTVPPPGNDPNQIGNSGLVNIYQNQGGAGALNTPFLLILGIPNAGN